MSTGTSNNEAGSSDTKPNKRRGKKSVVWEHFTTVVTEAGETKAVCNQCHKPFAYKSGDKLSGTSHLKRHIDMGICPVTRNRLRTQNDLLSPDTPPSVKTENTTPVSVRARKRYRATPGYSTISGFDQDRSINDLTKMIIQHDYPLEMIEHSAFLNFIKLTQPLFNLGNFDIRERIVELYLREKKALLSNLEGMIGKISLSLDLWDSDQTLEYVSLTAHFIDRSWKLQRRVLKVTLPCLNSEVDFKEAVGSCLRDWKVETKLFTVTLDHSFADESIKTNIHRLLSVQTQLSPIFVKSCYARILSQLAQEAMFFFSTTLEKVRESVRFVKSSKDREERFIILKQHLQVPSTKSLIIDDLTKWDTTYLMLVAATELKEVFSCLDTWDQEYVVNIKMEEWRQMEVLCVYLNQFFNAANIITTPVYPTANEFFDSVCNVFAKLKQGMISADYITSNLCKALMVTLERYWNDCHVVLATAAVMDPRFKMGLVNFRYHIIYGDVGLGWSKVVEDGIRQLLREYYVQSLPLNFELEEVMKTEDYMSPHESSSYEDEDSINSTNGDDGLSDYGFSMEDYEIMSNSKDMEAELDNYLNADNHPRVQGFDVIGWWRINNYKYPLLSQMALDILCIPVSTVAPECVFEIGNRKADKYGSSLRPPLTLEALVCAKDWIQYESAAAESVSGSSGQSSAESVPYQLPANAILKMEN